jgi:glycosyltransferase involved in cell wall biosynthesis
LAIIGEGPQKEELVQYSHNLGVVSQVDFLGALPPAQIQEWMRRARLMILPSIEEGLGVVLLEALASGTPCVASNAGGIPDIVTPDVGQLVPPADPKAIASAVKSFLLNPEHWQKLSQTARAKAEANYAWPVIAQRLIQVYTEVKARQA